MIRKAFILAAFLLLAGAGPVWAARQALPTTGEPRILTVLIEFQDEQFTMPDPLGCFFRMLNQEGYQEYGGTGSVRDYYRENSKGRFQPCFDVVGPVRLSKRMSAYGRDVLSGGVRQGDTAPDLALVEACSALDASVDFSRYDADGDGVVDLILYYYPGHDQAAGASSDRIWSQMGEIQGVSFDRKRLGTYICTSELAGSYGSVFCGIGLTCHELGHALGLPDLYDTDGTLNGQAGGPWQYSPMGRGCYNNNGRTPPYFTAQELLLLGWMPSSALKLLEQEGPVRFSPVQEYAAGKSNTSTQEEYYLYEYRNGEGWDAPLSKGIVIYHVDRSSRRIGGIPARELWDRWDRYNTLNARLEHPCFYAVPSSEVGLKEYSPSLQSGHVAFPGLADVYAYEPLDWDGNYTGLQLTNMERSDAQGAEAYVIAGNTCNLNGLVRDSEGRGLPDVQVAVNGQQKAKTNALGFYQVNMQDPSMPGVMTLSFSCDGYRSRQQQVTPQGAHVVSVPAVLRREGEADEHLLSFYDRQALTGYYARSGVGAVRYTAEELTPYAGNLLSRVDFYPCVQEGFNGLAYLTVDIGSRRVLTRLVDNRLLVPGLYRKISMDVSDAGILIPEGLDMYVGYGTSDASGTFRVGTAYPAEKGRAFFCPFDMNISKWEDLYQEESGYWMDVLLATEVAEREGMEHLESLGYNYIDPGSGEYHAGDVFQTQLVTTLETAPYLERWSWDGVRLMEREITLSAGWHRLSVYLDYGDGRTEELELELNVLD